jgi:hypothetical protein
MNAKRKKLASKILVGDTVGNCKKKLKENADI